MRSQWGRNCFSSRPPVQLPFQRPQAQLAWGLVPAGKGQWEQEDEKQEPLQILRCMPCSFGGDFMQILSKQTNKQKNTGVRKPFWVIPAAMFSFLPLSHLQIPQLTSRHLCFLFFPPSGLLFVRQSLTVWTWLGCTCLAPASHPYAQIPHYPPELVFGPLDLSILILAIHSMP